MEDRSLRVRVTGPLEPFAEGFRAGLLERGCGHGRRDTRDGPPPTGRSPPRSGRWSRPPPSSFGRPRIPWASGTPYLDTTCLRDDTGFAPAYDEEHAVADYVG